jgi:hypothetical protein
VATCAVERRPKSTACAVVFLVVTGSISLRGFCHLVTVCHKRFLLPYPVSALFCRNPEIFQAVFGGRRALFEVGWPVFGALACC